MARVLPINEIKSGSVGGQTFSRNKGGLYVRMKASPTNPSTERQQAVRGFLSAASGTWSVLSIAVRVA